MDSAEVWNGKYVTTPLRGVSQGDNSASSRHMSISPCKTPLSCNENNAKGKTSRTYCVRSNLIRKMPMYSPPTESVRHVKNPFEHARFLRERLSQPFCSPSLFEKIESPVKDDQFNWTIEDISILRPAPINEHPIQEFDSWFSPVTENEAQKAINKFFSSQIVNMESPVDVRPNRLNSDVLKVETVTSDAWSQTILSFPPSLPPDVEKILSMYCNFQNSQCNQDAEEMNSSNSSISRKKLLFDSVGNEDNVDGGENSLRNTSLWMHEDVGCKQAAASTPIKTALVSPELSPIRSDTFQDSLMDISVSFKSAS